jgi:hypothetical protein
MSAIIDEISSRKEKDIKSALLFFEKEYQLNHALGTSKKPVISIMNGITSNIFFLKKKWAGVLGFQFMGCSGLLLKRLGLLCQKLGLAFFQMSAVLSFSLD